MKAVVLLSAARHPETGNPQPQQEELQAIALANALQAETLGLYAGNDLQAVAPALGHGLTQIEHLAIPDSLDVLPALQARLNDIKPALVLAGGRSGRDATGMLPYLLAQAMGWPVLANIAAISVDGDAFVLDQALGKGQRRRIHQTGPLLVTVHSSALAAMPFAFARQRRGVISELAADGPDWQQELVERPLRPRPRLMRNTALGGSAAERLKAATEAASGDGELLIAPEAEHAARAILAHLRKLGLG
ncbi:electron transfer flavoprotein subunit beta [Aureimonas fodinaquatilis]|uniref:Electron transfer flavoprotein subunit beta n=1 Tax=Aureimonas fodinaquatilis TaxID=2565783 RepID=A0A5B0E1K8_9HYPH|nr:electron transfer flavoprotein subunit beta [Aureimonas fodinaquatilis]KAA0972538.1 electron transfer flavoprotein subunit beta [Aureimonas fodinaquatilis]